MSFSTGFKKCKKCGKMLFGLFDGEFCDECEKAEQKPPILPSCEACIGKSRYVDGMDLCEDCEKCSNFKPKQAEETIDKYAEQERTDEWQNGYDRAWEEAEVFYEKEEPTSPCDLCVFNSPSSADGKPCTMCPACPAEKAVSK